MARLEDIIEDLRNELDEARSRWSPARRSMYEMRSECNNLRAKVAEVRRERDDMKEEIGNLVQQLIDRAEADDG